MDPDQKLLMSEGTEGERAGSSLIQLTKSCETECPHTIISPKNGFKGLCW